MSKLPSYSAEDQELPDSRSLDDDSVYMEKNMAVDLEPTHDIKNDDDNKAERIINNS